MNKKKICFIAQFPPPIHGLSKAVDTLYNSNLKDIFEFEKIDITKNKNILKNLYLLKKSSANLFYFTISQSKMGNVRDLIIILLLVLRKKKCVVHLHGGYYRKLIDSEVNSLQRIINYKLIKKISGTVVLGNSLVNNFEGMIDKDKIFIVPNCVDEEYLITDREFEFKVRNSCQKDIKDVLYLSNFIKSKGYIYVLNMAKIEKQRYEITGKRNLHFNFAGKFYEEKDKKYFFEYIEKNELQEYITYYGVVENDKKRYLLKKCDIFILLTSYEKEGQPISILEAMGNGMFVMATNHSGIPDIVQDNVNGLIIEKEKINIEKCYEKLIDYIINYKLMKEIINNNREDILKRYSQDIYLNNIKNIFNKYL